MIGPSSTRSICLLWPSCCGTDNHFFWRIHIPHIRELLGRPSFHLRRLRPGVTIHAHTIESPTRKLSIVVSVSPNLQRIAQTTELATPQLFRSDRSRCPSCTQRVFFFCDSLRGVTHERAKRCARHENIFLKSSPRRIQIVCTPESNDCK